MEVETMMSLCCPGSGVTPKQGSDGRWAPVCATCGGPGGSYKTPEAALEGYRTNAIRSGWYTRTDLGRTHYYKANGHSLCATTRWRPGSMRPGRDARMKCHSCDVRLGEAEATEREARTIHDVKTVGDMLRALRLQDRDWPLVIEGGGQIRVRLDRGPDGPRMVITSEGES